MCLRIAWLHRKRKTQGTKCICAQHAAPHIRDDTMKEMNDEDDDNKENDNDNENEEEKKRTQIFEEIIFGLCTMYDTIRTIYTYICMW